MKYGIKTIGCLFLMGSLFACKRQPAASSATADKQHTIAFYNLENLFDTTDDPAIQDEEYLPESELEWDNLKYNAKLLNLSSVIEKLGDENGPELLGVCEVENKKVLEDLAATPALYNHQYDIVHYDSPDRRGIDVALLYKKNIFKPLQHRSLRVSFPDPEMLSRDMLLVKGMLAGDTVFVFVNHWPSRRGGAEASEINRVTVAKVLRHNVDSLLSLNPKSNIIIMGDFNDEPSDVSISQTLKAVKQPEGATTGSLFNAFAEIQEQNRGSYMYRGQYDMIDQIIMSQALLNNGKSLQHVPGSASIFMPERIQETDPKYKGAPLRTFAGKKYLGGFSDHFPVYIHVRVNK
ncbi:MAG: endonuclease/exonuclease/phosphatase family protein [Hymenobacteraceae bacterium]|nr:endonuclease/exonuclease/phosphatase family protein [Hymenobacteraceae bacterium]MDX5397685.1 endonuclease/exonuclease/phosphatase family protein [Hymenobacteraceae bacterium]MDX5444057.1 endonuclease/exonuclease/phosphatase family protein [Hymenobacteraceae bacterium]MDX5513763.1 endonuclease/exonuclease/phosphatase family protein [Hymenobacteraceae bacterium]